MSDLATPSLTDLEGVIERGMTTFVDVGRALWDIRERRLYRDAGYTDFDSYCRERWGFSRDRADQMVAAARVVESLPTIVGSPTNEAQARELARVKDPEVIREVWQEATERHGEKVTAANVRQIVDERLAPSPEPHAAPPVSIAKAKAAKVDAEMTEFVESLPEEAVESWVALVKQTEMEPFVAGQLADARYHVHQAGLALKRIPDGAIRAHLNVPRIVEHINDTSLMAFGIFSMLKDATSTPEQPTHLRRVQ